MDTNREVIRTIMAMIGLFCTVAAAFAFIGAFEPGVDPETAFHRHILGAWLTMVGIAGMIPIMLFRR